MEGKDKILSAAANIFAQKGFTKSKILDIANEAGVSKKTIYKFFNSKDELVLEVYGSLIMKINKDVQGLINSEVTIPKKLAGIIEIASLNLHGVTPTLVSDARESVPKIRDFIDQYVENAVFTRFRTLMDEGIAAGVIKQDLDVDSVMLLYRDAIFSFIYMRYSRNVPAGVNPKAPIVMFCEALSTIFRGILTNDAKAQFEAHLEEAGL